MKTPMGLGSNSSSERFDSWSGSYENSFTWRHFFEPVHEMLAQRLGDVTGSSIVDVGCGTGGLLRRLASCGAERLTGVDESPGMLEVARAHSGEMAGLEFMEASAESLPPGDGEFDVALSCIAFHHFPDPGGALQEMRRVLKPGGRLLICDMCGEGLLSRMMLLYGRLIATDRHYYDRKSLAALARVAGFDVAGTWIINRFPPAMLLTAVKPAEKQ